MSARHFAAAAAYNSDPRPLQVGRTDANLPGSNFGDDIEVSDATRLLFHG